MLLNTRKDVQNFLKVIDFNHPEWIPGTISLLPATWLKYGERLEKIVLSHPAIFPAYKPGDFKKINIPISYKKGTLLDVWGILWKNLEEGMESAPVEESAPLRNWEDLKNYKVPDPLKYDRFGVKIDWKKAKENVEATKRNGGLPVGYLYHGAMYMQLYYLRGFTNFMMDVATKDPRLDKLIEIVLHYNLKQIEKWIETGVRMIVFGDDLGLQKSLPISPQAWRHYIKPCFSSMFGLCRKNNVYVYLHTDGYILDIIPDLIGCGANIINPQIRPNTLAGLKEYCRGKIAINLDLDRQLFPFASKSQIEDHIKEAVETLYIPEGGLMLTAECAADVPLETINNICSTFESLNVRAI